MPQQTTPVPTVHELPRTALLTGELPPRVSLEPRQQALGRSSWSLLHAALAGGIAVVLLVALLGLVLGVGHG